MPKRKHFFFQEGFPNTASQKYSFVLKSVALVIVDDTDVGNTKKKHNS